MYIHSYFQIHLYSPLWFDKFLLRESFLRNSTVDSALILLLNLGELLGINRSVVLWHSNSTHYKNLTIFDFDCCIQGAAYVFERLSEATVRPELYFFDFQRFLAWKYRQNNALKPIFLNIISISLQYSLQPPITPTAFDTHIAI